jgi:hypothetical protein
MSRNLKALGLALIAVLALSGIAAVSAQAETAVESELKSPAVTKIDVTNAVNKHGELARLTIGNGARFVECTNIDFTGTITGSATTVTGTAEFTNCFANGLSASPVTVTHNKCTLEVTALKASTANTTVKCPGGAGQVEIHVFENAEAQKLNKPLCTYDITIPVAGQTVTGAPITTGGAAGKTHDLVADLSKATKLKEVFNTGPGGLAVCGVASGKHTEGAFTGKVTITGTEAANPGVQVGITLI